ncbi:serine threonine kinase [Pyrenophora seminiperda CCB06]|uniref:Serine threonine kinase n=1 Tax=Pyrenophora seminiperda CCB06 TaxID=1302712 RepID=A0A3M7MCG6_9PLEO|nr:serine threonine kinase [Pyrenophora seminiperda CCB06]
MDPARRHDSSASEPCVKHSLVEEIHDAVDSTVEAIPEQDAREARCFLAKFDLHRILNQRSLEHLFRELLQEAAEDAVPVNLQAYSAMASEREGNSRSSGTDDRIDHCIRETIGTPSRVALLALFLYLNREPLLHIFLQWLTPGRVDKPSDESIPFSKTKLYQYGVPQIYHREIIWFQAIFDPVTVREQEHMILRTTDRLPLLGAQTHIKNGSSGTVVTTSIAPKHWEIKSDGRFVVGNPESPKLVAMKTFKEIPTVRNMEEATNDFTIERGILQELRNCNIKHDMIILDSGSITVVDAANRPISHSLIFELATFSLTDFLKDERRARTYTAKSLLLERLVDIVEALACLHDNLKTLHLDIKPDNILVFEQGLSRSDNQNQDQHELILKLSDFGLARKIGAGPRTGHNMIDRSDQLSRSSATPATRPAGVYQAPEIQERSSSKAGRGSDVWSIGCVALMVLAFVTDGPAGVLKLISRLSVDFLHGGGCQSLFYVRSDSYSWNDVHHYRYQYLENFNPVTGVIPGTQTRLEAAVNPQVIQWSNVLYDSYSHQPEQPFIKDWFDVIFRSVLLIDHSARLSAAKMRDKLQVIQQRWKLYEEKPESYIYQQSAISHQRRGSSAQLQQDPPRERTQGLDIKPRPFEDSPEQPLQDPPALNDATTEPVLVQTNSHTFDTRQPSSVAADIQSHLDLRSAIRDDNAEAVQTLLNNDIELLKHYCPGSRIYPIHFALKHDRYQALDVLLENSNTSITNLTCNGRTVLQLACLNPGDTKALKCIRKHVQNFHISEDVYKQCKKNRLGSEARDILDDLYKAANPKPRSKGIRSLFS